MVHRDAELNRRRREWVHFPEAVLDFGRWEIERGVKGSSRPGVEPAAWGAPAAARVERFIAKAGQPHTSNVRVTKRTSRSAWMTRRTSTRLRGIEG